MLKRTVVSPFTAHPSNSAVEAATDKIDPLFNLLHNDWLRGNINMNMYISGKFTRISQKTFRVLVYCC